MKLLITTVPLLIFSSLVVSECRRQANGLVYNCGADKDLVQFNSFEFDPPTPTKGRPLSVKMFTKVKENIDKDTNFTISVRRTNPKLVSDVKNIFSFTKPLCFLMGLSGKGCPVRRGDIELNFSQIYFFRLLQAGNYTFDLYSETKDKKAVFNARLDYNITEPKSE